MSFGQVPELVSSSIKGVLVRSALRDKITWTRKSRANPTLPHKSFDSEGNLGSLPQFTGLYIGAGVLVLRLAQIGTELPTVPLATPPFSDLSLMELPRPSTPPDLRAATPPFPEGQLGGPVRILPQSYTQPLLSEF